RLYLRLDGDDTVADAAFEGTGCAISVASASLLTEMVIGKSRDDALLLFQVITERLTESTKAISTDVDIGKIRALDGVREFPARVKCATLAWHALNSAFKNHKSPASTE
ncbi:MAG: Fe-S cluster assembly sulfur transfer protein SufU, partial [Woeseiaceae bacterium]